MAGAGTVEPWEHEFSGELWFWKGPAPWYFVSVPAEDCLDLQELSASVTYGWGMIPARVQVGDSAWDTALWPKDGGYIVPVKAAVRKAEGLQDGDRVTVRLSVTAADPW